MWRDSLTRAKRASEYESREKEALSPVSFTVFCLVSDLLFDCSRVLEYAKIRTENLAKRSSLLRPFHYFLVNIIRTLVNEISLLRPVPPFTSKYHQNISKLKSRWKVKPFVPVPLFTSKYCQDTLVNEKIAKRSSFLRTFHNLLVNSERILVNANLAKTVMPFLPASPFTSNYY